MDIKRYGHSNFHFSENPVNIHHTLLNVDKVVSHGGHGLIMDCMEYKKPMKFYPMVVEQAMNAKKVNNLYLSLTLASQSYTKKSVDI